MNVPAFCAASRYRPKFTLNDVLPVPEHVEATPPRGQRSLLALDALGVRIRHRGREEATGPTVCSGK